MGALNRFIGKTFFKILGWELLPNNPNVPKYMCVLAPHTSIWDMVYGKMYNWATDMKPKIMVPAVAAMTGGPMNLVTDAPTLPAPKMPRARPCRPFENQAEFQATPTENELPAKPTRNARTSNIA